MKLSMDVRGTQALKQGIKALGAELSVKALATAARKAFKPVLEAAVAAAPVDSGLLRDHIKIRVQKPKSGDAVAVVGLYIARAKVARNKTRVGRGQVKAADPSWRWQWTELGTKYSAAQPFLQPALDQNADLVVKLLQQELEKSVQRAIKRKAKAEEKAKLSAMRGGALGLDLSGGIA